MATFLSPMWIDELVALASQAEPPAGSPALVVQFEVPAGPVWHVGWSGVAPVAGAGPADPPADVVITHDASTAEAIHAGHLNVQQAVAEGRVRVRGDVVRLRDGRAVMAAIATATAPLRAAR